MSSSSARCIAKHVLEPDSGYDFTVIANEYEVPNPAEDGLTLIFLHASGFFKEVWEPLLRLLFERIGQDKTVNLRDVYSIESPNHGESAILNEKVLSGKYYNTWRASMYTEAIKRFLTAGTDGGAKVDFSKRRLVGIGHSLGGAAIVMLPKMVPELPFERFIIIEGAINRPDTPERFQMSQTLTYLAWTRRDVWTSMKSAMKGLKANPVYAQWDDETFNLFCKHALRPHPGSRYASPYTFKGITTCLTREQEAALVRDEELVYRAFQEYAELTRVKPVHIIYCRYPDLGPPELQKTQVDKSLGCYPVSVSYVEDAGHLVVQQNPKGTSDAIFSILTGSVGLNEPQVKSHL